ncbi:replicative protein [Halhan virus 2]|uniref:replicative protein n=1 Tax=Halhan virus 2 TaxID=2480177 RepID=UPI000F0C6EB4|nr:replicative protein [Halhan virus 2]AYN75550.1 replicative protein [Halhan virus 2]
MRAFLDAMPDEFYRPKIPTAPPPPPDLNAAPKSSAASTMTIDASPVVLRPVQAKPLLKKEGITNRSTQDLSKNMPLPPLIRSSSNGDVVVGKIMDFKTFKAQQKPCKTPQPVVDILQTKAVKYASCDTDYNISACNRRYHSFVHASYAVFDEVVNNRAIFEQVTAQEVSKQFALDMAQIFCADKTSYDIARCVVAALEDEEREYFYENLRDCSKTVADTTIADELLDEIVYCIEQHNKKNDAIQRQALPEYLLLKPSAFLKPYMTGNSFKGKDAEEACTTGFGQYPNSNKFFYDKNFPYPKICSKGDANYYTPFHPLYVGTQMPPEPIIAFSDLTNYLAHHGADKIKKVTVALDVEIPNGLQRVPYYGVVLDVSDNTVHGIPFEVEPMKFSIVVTEPAVFEAAKMHAISQLAGEKSQIYKELHNQTADYLRNLEPQVSIINVMNGTYGCGKTTAIKQMMKKEGQNHENTVVCCPSRPLANDYGKGAYTWARAFCRAMELLEMNNLNAIYIDEVYNTHPLIVLALGSLGVPTYAIGDPRQMRPGGEGANYKIKTLDELWAGKVTDYRDVSFSAPIDVVNTFNKEYERKTYTLSTVFESVVYKSIKSVKEIPAHCDKNCKEDHEHNLLLVFTTRAQDTTKGTTVASAQGLRKKSIDMFFEQNAAGCFRIHGQKLVGFTRHTEKLNVYTCAKTTLANKIRFTAPTIADRVGARHDFATYHGEFDLLSASYIDGEKIKCVDKVGKVITPSRPERVERIEELAAENQGKAVFTLPSEYLATHYAHVRPPVDSELPQLATLEEQDVLVQEQPGTTTFGTNDDPQYTAQVLTQIAAPALGPIPSQREVNILKIAAMKKNTTMHVHTDKPLVTQCEKPTHAFMAPIFGVKQTGQSTHVINTTVERYAAVSSVPIKKRDVESYSEKLLTGLAKFVDTDKFRPPTTAEFEACRSQTLLRVAAKKQYPEPEIYGQTVQNTMKIKSFTKKQLKSKVGDFQDCMIKDTGSDYKVKGGQMVCAQTKQCNESTAAYVAWAERQVMENLREGVMLGYGDSTSRLRTRISRRIRKCRKTTYECVSCDMDQQDTTKNDAVNLYMRKIYRSCGVPDKIIDMLEMPNEKWLMKTKTTSVNVNKQFQSGRSDTLFANTMHSIGEAGKSFEIRELMLALFQGDDSYIRAHKIAKTSDFFERLKVDRNLVGDFVGLVIGTDDVSIDIPRITGKLLTRSMIDNARYEEIKLAARDMIKITCTPETTRKAILYNAFKYHCMEGTMSSLLEFLQFFADPRRGTPPEKATKDNATLLKIIITPFMVS